MVGNNRYERTVRFVGHKGGTSELTASLGAEWEMRTSEGEKLVWDTTSKTPLNFDKSEEVLISFKVVFGSKKEKWYRVENVRVKNKKVKKK